MTDRVDELRAVAERATEDVHRQLDSLVEELGTEFIKLVSPVSERPDVIQMASMVNSSPEYIAMAAASFAVGKVAATHPNDHITRLYVRARMLMAFADGINLKVFGVADKDGRD